MSHVVPLSPGDDLASSTDLSAELERLRRENLALRQGLQKSEERFRAHALTTPDLVYAIDARGTLLRANPAFAARTGYVVETLMGLSLLDIVREDRRRALERFLARLAEGEESLPYHELPLYTADEGVIWLGQTTCRLAIPQGGDEPVFECVAIEVTERRQAEDELWQLQRRTELILNAVGDGIYGTDTRGGATFVNPAAARLTGYSAEDLLGQPIHDVIHGRYPNGEPYPREECGIYRAVVRGETYRTDDVVFWRRDGTSFAAECMCSPIVESGKVVGSVVVFRDITQRTEVDRLKHEFVSVVSHELRTPLTSIRGSLGLVAGGVLKTEPEKGQRMLEIAMGNTDRLIRLINDLLDLERMASGRAPLQRQDLALDPLLGSALETLEPIAERAGVRLRMDSGPSGTYLWADPDRVTQLLTNLLSNAIKFSPPGQEVLVSAEVKGDEVLLSVRDRGRGIPADQLETVFEWFTQVDASDARDKGGTGLGLAICRMIVTQHEGRIWAEIPPEGGTVVRVVLPRQEGRSAPPARGGSDGPLVLICDDDQSVLEVVSLLVGHGGFRVIPVGSGRSAIDAAKEERPDAIVMDLLMPGFSGVDTIAALRGDPATAAIPVVVLSALRPGDVQLDPASVEGWVGKPPEEAGLFEAIHAAIARGRDAGRA